MRQLDAPKTLMWLAILACLAGCWYGFYRLVEVVT